MRYMWDYNVHAKTLKVCAPIVGSVPETETIWDGFHLTSSI